MYNRTLVPPEFIVPDGLACGTYHLRMLTIRYVDKDFEAVMASRERIAGLLDPESSWPQGLTREEDLIDLAWHQREFTLRHSFAYTVMAPDESQCLGCAYIFPSNAPAFDAAAFYWVRAGTGADARDADLGDRFRGWLRTEWPFHAVAFPGRSIPWAEWKRLQPPPMARGTKRMPAQSPLSALSNAN